LRREELLWRMDEARRTAETDELTARLKQLANELFECDVAISKIQSTLTSFDRRMLKELKIKE
jgi:hypothetical protein